MEGSIIVAALLILKPLFTCRVHDQSDTSVSWAAGDPVWITCGLRSTSNKHTVSLNEATARISLFPHLLTSVNVSVSSCQ